MTMTRRNRNPKPGRLHYTTDMTNTACRLGCDPNSGTRILRLVTCSECLEAIKLRYSQSETDKAAMMEENRTLRNELSKAQSQKHTLNMLYGKFAQEPDKRVLYFDVPTATCARCGLIEHCCVHEIGHPFHDYDSPLAVTSSSYPANWQRLASSKTSLLCPACAQVVAERIAQALKENTK